MTLLLLTQQDMLEKPRTLPPTAQVRRQTTGALRAGRSGFEKPSLSTARETIAALRRLDLRTASPDALGPRVGRLMGGLVLRVPPLRIGWPVFRGVKWATRPTKISQLTYPPVEIVKVLQRANREGQPRFYGSSGANAPFYELRSQVGDHIALSTWRVAKEGVVNHIGYMPEILERLQSHKAVGRVAQQMAPELSYGPVDRLIHNFLATEFSKDVTLGSEHLYKLSVAIAERLLVEMVDSKSEVARFDGLLYPSLAMRGNSDNVCLLPRFVDEGLHFIGVDYVRVDEINLDGSYLLANIDHANTVAPDGSIDWLGSRSKEPKLVRHSP
jgi:hypothetical protein